jgi:ubiquinone/menaquinone biosynthesis C-methylase UbiE
LGDSGQIFANDIVEDKLQTIRKRCLNEGIKNIAVVLGETEDPKFPLDTLEMAIMVYVLHDLERPEPFLKNLKSYLKPEAPIVIVDRDPAKYGGQDGHFFTKEKILQILKQANLEVVKILTFLPRDNIYICQPR